MTTLLVIVGIVLVVLAVVGPVVYWQWRRVFREHKNYERGLKMVPLYIHLPPPSDDIEANGRDVRDLLDENISRAQIIYNIIASTFQRDFKSQFYGQRHFAFEIVGWQGFVYFYAAVPISMVDIVRQAVVSAYPSARLEEVAERNIFSPVGRISGTTGGELHLKESFAYPIATYQDLKRDALQSILNALSTLDKQDGVGIQFLLRPAPTSWTKTAKTLANEKRQGKKSDQSGGKSFLNFAGQLATAVVKAPENSDTKKDPAKDVSNLDQAIIDSIEDKTRYPGYETLIRVVASSNVSQRAQAILANVVAAFALLDAPGRNGFKYVPAKDIESLATAYIMRFFPQNQNKDILNSVELASLFHFPDQSNIPTSQLERQESKQVDGPRNMPDDGLLLGYNVFRGQKKAIYLSLPDRQRHMYVVGQTGVGKSVFLENLALQDMLSGNGFAFVDPHGDTAERLLAMVPKERTEDVIYFSPAEMDYPMGLNLFEFHSSDQKDFLIQEGINMLYKMYDPQHQGIMGPRYEHMFRMAALTAMADPAGGTFIDLPKLYRDTQFMRQKLQYVTDPTVIEYWQKEVPQSQRSNDFGEVVSWFSSKFGAFLSNDMMRRILGQPKSAFDLRDIMDNKKILLVNLSKGRTGDLNSKLLGMIFVMKFQAAAMSRANIPENQRVDFSLYVDEFQNFSTDSFATIMSEARKYHFNLIVANQFTTQLSDEIRDAVFGNMGTIIGFRIGQNDVDALTRYFQPTFDGNDLLRIPNFNTVVRTMIGGVPTQPFSMATLPPLGSPNEKLAEALKQLSAAKYGRPRAVVEAEITERLRTKADLPAAFGGSASTPFGSPFDRPAGVAAGGSSAFGAMPGGGLPPRPGLSPSASATGSSSFLDDWLSKKRQSGSAGGAGSVSPSGPGAAAPPGMSPTKPAAASPAAHTSNEQNISSNELQKQEIATIAHQLAGPLQPTGSPQTGSGSAASAQDDGTIYIDREGNLQQGASTTKQPE